MKSKSILYFSGIEVASLLLFVVLCSFFIYIVISYFKFKSQEGMAVNSPKKEVGVVCMMKKPKNLETWLNKHRELGIHHFYIRIEDTPELLNYLQVQDDVTFMDGKGNEYNSYNVQQKRQDNMVDHYLKIAQNDGNNIQWLVHIDCDEILEGDLEEIKNLPDDVHTFWFENKEAKFSKVPEQKDNCFNASKFYKCSEHPDKCVSYGNGKSGAKVCKQTRGNGPHRCKSIDPKGKEIKLENIYVKHYESCDLETYKRKFKRMANQDNNTSNDIPFSYYKDSIDAINQKDDTLLKNVFEKYRVEK